MKPQETKVQLFDRKQRCANIARDWFISFITWAVVFCRLAVCKIAILKFRVGIVQCVNAYIAVGAAGLKCWSRDDKNAVLPRWSWRTRCIKSAIVNKLLWIPSKLGAIHIKLTNIADENILAIEKVKLGLISRRKFLLKSRTNFVIYVY